MPWHFRFGLESPIRALLPSKLKLAGIEKAPDRRSQNWVKILTEVGCACSQDFEAKVTSRSPAS